MLNTAPDLYGSEYSQLISEEIERLDKQNRPLAVDITVKMSASGGEYESASLSPVLYAVYIPLLLLSATFCALLCPAAEKDTSELILINGINRYKISFAYFISQLFSFFMITAVFELLFKLFSIENDFSPASRTVFALLISAAAAVVFRLFSKARSSPLVLFLGIVWAAVSIVFSGAFISPALFGAFEPIKYLSPSWLLLRLMTAVTAL